jgi:putative DNA methylase
MPPHEVITRRRLPHWYVPGACHFITYRLAGTVLLAVLLELRAQHQALLKRSPPPGRSLAEHRERAHKRFFADYDDYLDTHRELDWLARPPIAAIIRSNLYHHDGGKYHLIAYCVMPNHVHVLLQPIAVEANTETGGDEVADGQSPLAGIMHSLKSYTANRANTQLGRRGPFWQGESYDHWVRDEDELERIVAYIAHNPVKAGLVKQPHEWFFCSAHDRFLLDGTSCGWLEQGQA